MKLKLKVARPEKIKIDTEFIKLDSFLKFSNAVESGGMAKEAVAEGLVRVNGEVCVQRGRKLRPGDRVVYDGQYYEITDED